jgi:hypothetical protein
MDEQQMALWVEAEDMISGLASAARLHLLDVVTWCRAADRWPGAGMASAMTAMYALGVALQAAERAAEEAGLEHLAQAAREIRARRRRQSARCR